MKALKTLLLTLAAAMAISCTQTNPANLYPSGPAADIKYAGIVEKQDNFLFYGPTSSGIIVTQAPAFGGPVQTTFGGVSSASFSWLTGGVGGPTGVPGTDWFIRWQGSKGPDAALDYCSMSMFFKGMTTDFDLSAYKGITFFARGHGSFAVALAGPGTSTGQAGPYKGYNYFTKIFGSNLSGDTEWKQITINFSSLTQLYGAAANLSSVLKGAWGLQFNQEVPIVASFRLDLDYIRLIPADSVSGY